jgi:hypothetical protein
MAKTTPTAYIFALLIGFFLATLWYRDRFNFYDLQITAYKERLGEVPKETKYTRLTNKELQQEESRLASHLWGFQKKNQTEEADAMRRLLERQKVAKSEDEVQRIQQEQNNEDMQRKSFYDMKFQREFFADIIALRNEILERLPLSSVPQRLRESYVEDTLASGFLTGPDPVGAITSELQQLANLLPSQPRSWLSLRWQDCAFTFGVLASLYFWLLRQWAKYRRERSQPTLFPNLR